MKNMLAIAGGSTFRASHPFACPPSVRRPKYPKARPPTPAQWQTAFSLQFDEGKSLIGQLQPDHDRQRLHRPAGFFFGVAVIAAGNVAFGGVGHQNGFGTNLAILTL